MKRWKTTHAIEKISILNKGGESSKSKHKDKPKKEGKENRDDDETSIKGAKEDKLSKLKGVLKTVANGYETGKKILL